MIKARSDQGEDLYGQEPLRGQGAKRTEARPGEAARDKSNGQRPCRGQGRNAAEKSYNMAKGHAENKGGTQQDWPIAHDAQLEEGEEL